MNKKIILFLTLLSFFVYSLQAQVTIGSGHNPNTGALLDLKQEQTTGTSNSNKGLILPRVLMTTTTPLVGEMAKSIGGTGVWGEAEHTGLLVYSAKNTLDACTGGAYEGVYSWNGKKWLPLQIKKMTPPTTEIATDQHVGANSYIVKTGGNVSIPIKRAFDIWTDYAGSSPATGKVLSLSDVNNLTGALSAQIVWQDAGSISSAVINGTGSAATLDVVAGNTGNALIRVLIAGKVLWQWHIWVSDYDPLETATPYIIAGETNWYMDRFLGATATSGTDAYGLHYQWGRHIPMPKAGMVETVAGTASEKENLTNAIQSEKFLLYYTTLSHDWYSATPKIWDIRWGDIKLGETKKSPFDPCPRGWRLPSNSSWECLDANSTDEGVGQFNETGRELGYLAPAGYRSNGDGSLGDVGIAGYIWSASPNGDMAGAIFYNNTTINVSDKYNRANAMNVRCLKEK